jgi:hypothetical protein
MPEKKNLDERAKIEIELATYLEIALVAADGETLDYVKKQIAELEGKLRQIGE